MQTMESLEPHGAAPGAAFRRLFLIHWHAGESGAAAASLSRLGWTVRTETIDGSRALTRMASAPVDVAVISLARGPSHGIRTGYSLRILAATAGIPIVFLDADGAAEEEARRLVPDATFTTLDGLPGALARF